MKDNQARVWKGSRCVYVAGVVGRQVNVRYTGVFWWLVFERHTFTCSIRGTEGRQMCGSGRCVAGRQR